MVDPRLETALRNLGEEIDWPPPVDFAARLHLDRAQRPRWRRVAWVAALLAVVSAISLLPAARRAVADLLEVAGIRFEFGNAPDLPPPSTIPLGELTDLDGARDAVDFSILIPATLDPPSSVHLLQWPLGTQVFLVWTSSERLPEVGESGIGVLFAQFRANLDEPFFAKIVEEGTTVERVTVNGSEAFWLAGAPHVFMFETGRRDLVEDSTRLTGNVLVWEADGVTYRLESALDLDQSLAIAGSLTP